MSESEDIDVNPYVILGMAVCGVLFLASCCLPFALICVETLAAKQLRAQLKQDKDNLSTLNKRLPVPAVSDPIDRISQERDIYIRPLQLDNDFSTFNIYSGEKSVKDVLFSARGQLPFTFSVGIPPSIQDEDEDPEHMAKAAMQKWEAFNASSCTEEFSEQEQILKEALNNNDTNSLREALVQLQEIRADRSLLDRGKAELAKQGQDADYFPTNDQTDTDTPFIFANLDKEVVRTDHCCETDSQVSVFDASAEDQIQIGLITRPARLKPTRFKVEIRRGSDVDSPPTLIVQGPAWQSACISSLFKLFSPGEDNAVCEILDVADGEAKRVGFISKTGLDDDAEYIPGGCYVCFGSITDPACKTMLLATALYMTCRVFVQ